MAGSPKRSRAERRKPDQILSGSVRSASYNIIFQVSKLNYELINGLISQISNLSFVSGPYPTLHLRPECLHPSLRVPRGPGIVQCPSRVTLLVRHVPKSGTFSTRRSPEEGRRPVAGNCELDLACVRLLMIDKRLKVLSIRLCSVPATIFWSLLFGYIWCFLLSNPGPPGSSVADKYQASVWWVVVALVADSFSEVPYIVGQYFLFAKLRVRKFFKIE